MFMSVNDSKYLTPFPKREYEQDSDAKCHLTVNNSRLAESSLFDNIGNAGDHVVGKVIVNNRSGQA